MIRTGSLHKACDDLFTYYPLAVQTISHSESVRSMILMKQCGGDTAFFVLTQEDNEGQPSYSINSWRMPDRVSIGPDADATVPEAFANVIAEGVPFPRHGSLFGWNDRGTITALIAVYAQYTVMSPEPSWATMPLAGIPETRWPTFTDEHFFGRWFWKHYRTQTLIALDGIVAATRGVVFWANTVATLGSGCCVVANDIMGSDGFTLQRGCYVYYQALRAGMPVPPLSALLADSGKIDLAPWFGRSGPSDSGSQWAR
jgi:hypothetical protein